MPIQASAVALPDQAENTTEAGRYAREFIGRLLEVNGMEKVSDLSRAMNLSRDEERKLYKWARAETAPNMLATIRLLRFAGVLDREPLEGQLAESPGLPGHPTDIAAVAAGLVAEIRDLLVEQFADLDERLTRLEEAPAPPRARSKRAASKGSGR